MGRFKSYKDTPFERDIESNCLYYERLAIQQILNSKNPQKEFEKLKDQFKNPECRKVVESLVKWLPNTQKFIL